MKTTKAEEKSKLWLKKPRKKKYMCITIQTLKKNNIDVMYIFQIWSRKFRVDKLRRNSFEKQDENNDNYVT